MKSPRRLSTLLVVADCPIIMPHRVEVRQKMPACFDSTPER